MDDAALVGMLKRLADLNCGADQRFEIVGRLLMQAGPFDEFHHNEGSFVHLACVVDRDDIGVIELGDRFSLLQQPRSAFCFHLVASHEFHRHFALQSCVEGAVNSAHASLAEHFFQTVTIAK